MPLRLSISLSRKVGEANYGSRGASVGLELETEVSLVQRPEDFQQQAAQLFRLARDSVDRELSRPLPEATAVGCGTNGAATAQSRPLRTATARQVRALELIAARRQLHLRKELVERYGVTEAAELSLGQASALIDALNVEDQPGESEAATTDNPAAIDS